MRPIRYITTLLPAMALALLLSACNSDTSQGKSNSESITTPATPISEGTAPFGTNGMTAFGDNTTDTATANASNTDTTTGTAIETGGSEGVDTNTAQTSGDTSTTAHTDNGGSEAGATAQTGGNATDTQTNNNANNGGTATTHNANNATNGSDDNATTGGNDGNTTTGGGDGNTATTPTVTLKSLKLRVAKTSLNKDTNTTVKVIATYSDNTTKEVTDKVEWVATPKDALKVTGTTLTALKDTNVTIQAKAGTTLSNKIKLHIYWEVDGHRLPPEPDPKVNNATLLGIDSNHNGVRDDVERWIYDRYKNSHPVMIPLRMQAARAYQKIIVDPSKAYETNKYMVDAQNCEWAFTSLSANYFGRKPLVLIEPEDAIKEDKELEYVQYNTTQRARAYANYNQTLSGGVFELEYPSEKWIENCDFNTTKFIEMSEKL